MAKNYIKKLIKKINQQPQIYKGRKWHINDKPSITCNYRVREEFNDYYLCMIEEKGVITLNKKAYLILKLINGKNSINDIQNRLLKEFSLKINIKEIEEILNIFIE